MYKPVLAVLLLSPLSLAIQSSPRLNSNSLVARLPQQLSPRNIPVTLLRRQTCSSNGEATCEQSCMPTDAVCCDDGSSTYCPNGEYCVTNGCCATGTVCDGIGGGTSTLFDAASSTQGSSPTSTPLGGSDTCSSSGQAVCEDSCMPTDATCCNDGNSDYCPSGEYCVANGCCANGEICNGTGGGTQTVGDGGSVPTTTSKQTLQSTQKQANPSPTTAQTTSDSGSNFNTKTKSAGGAATSGSSSAGAQQTKGSSANAVELNKKAIAIGVVAAAGYLL